MDMGIIKNLKMNYRSSLVQFTLKAIEDSLLTAESKAQEVSSKINVLQAIEFLADSWRDIENKTIQNCFSHCDFQVPDTSFDPSIINIEIMHNFDSVVNVDAFLAIDDNVICCDVDEDDLVKQIAENMLDEKNDTTEILEDELFEIDCEPVLMNDEEAMECVKQLRRYFMKEGNEKSPKLELDVCHEFIASKLIKK